MKIGLAHSLIREDEKLLIEAARIRGVDLFVLDARQQVFSPMLGNTAGCDLILERCVSTVTGMHVAMFFESIGVPVVNSMKVRTVCENKFLTSLELQKDSVPTVPFALAFSEQEARSAVDLLGGFPVVLKPVSGSWGRLLAKINDQDALEAVIEQKMVLGSPSHKALYLQKYIDKRGRDIRVTVVDQQVLCAIYREADHWITNTARGAKSSVCHVDRELETIAQKASQSVSGGVLGIDVFETDNGYLINEVNHTPEFKNITRATGIDVAGAIIEYCQTRV